MTNIILVLASHFVPLTDSLLVEAYAWAVEREESTTDLLQEDFGDALVMSLSSA